MKKWKIMLSLFVLLLLFSQIGHAASNKTIQVSMNGAKVSVTQVPIIMDGQAINTEFPSFVHTNRTLVPIRFVSESYGAEVSWDQKTKTATVAYGNKEGKFTIDSNVAIINGEKRILDQYAIPRIASLGGNSGRTMVPLKFVTEIFGYEVGWDSAKNAPYINSKQDTKPEVPQDGSSIISSISVGKGSTDKNKLIINSSKSIDYETMFLQDSNKLIIDIKDSKLSLENTKDAEGTIDVKDSIIEKIQYSQFSKEPNITRIVVTLNQIVEHNVLLTNDGKDMAISFGNKVKSITKELIDGKEAIVIHGTSEVKVNFMKLKNPERVVIDLMDSVLEGSTYYNYDYDLGFVKGVRVSQFNVDNNYSPMDQIVRIVLDVKDGISDPNVKVDTYGDKIVIYPEKSFWENISYTSEGDNKIFTINNLVETDYSVNYETGNKWIQVTIPTDNVELNEGIVSIKDGLIDEIQVVKDEIETRVFIKFRKSIEYVLLSRESDSKVSLMIMKDENVKTSDRLIVIDAGHGGKDPGATSINKRREKDLNLSVSLKLNDALKAQGYNTIMTRDTDEFIDLYERARIANDNYADVFVSIHGNSHDNKSIAGIQVLYCPATQSEKKEIDQHPFAKIIMDELLKATGAVDKGIIQRPNLVVLRETKMPAVLVETGFLSNSAEENLLFTEEYQYKIVNAIIKGIEKYFEMY
ncbi:N-acetylmuramoyl-L-alanine amidase family protein [Tissierella carlieri]|uniref:N-acetylmuramoyl-L-alanine amidase family protein n=1 Tax=Tissierella carlieri TaxID=689904 RepID=A0ABT1SGU2_9FIRM|nr:N-acetylmuramoyl-L-alanine amidase [Tissierella carlieri]MCQ4925714.1 N-acetylmuramoyl-L-alanine amidase family protein [Tissierella carlieri]